MRDLPGGDENWQTTGLKIRGPEEVVKGRAGGAAVLEDVVDIDAAVAAAMQFKTRNGRGANLFREQYKLHHQRVVLGMMGRDT